MERRQEGLRKTLGRPDHQIRSPGRLLLLLTTISLFLSVHCAAAIQLPDEMARFVPECGRECFLSHMKVYYGVSDEQWIPSLQLLCSTLGLSTITIGEGAYGCLLGERRIGYCSKEEITDAFLYKTYHMCSDKPKALKPTHAVFIPRFTRPASLPGRLIVPPLSTSSKSKQSTTSASTTTTTSSSSSLSQTPTTDQGSDLPSDTTSASSSPGSTRTQPPTSTSPTSSTTTTTESSASSSDSIAPPSPPDSSSAPSQPSARPTDVLSDISNDKQPPPLSIGEKAGIAVGAVSLAGAALSLLLFFCHRRRRQARTHASPAPAKGPAARGPDKGFPPPVAGLFPGPKSPLPPAPVAYSPASWRRSTIGLALSPMQAPWPSAPAPPPPPPGSSPPPSRRFSKLLPAKPVLRPRRVPSADARLRPAPPPVRDSATTEFEEDGQASPPPMVPIWLGPPLPPPDAVELEANSALPPPLFAVSVEPPSPNSTPWSGLRLVDPSPSPEPEAGHGASPGRRRHHPPMPLPGSLNGPAPGSRSCPTAALAAKRLGPERAAALAITTPPPSTRNRPPAWRRVGPSPEGPGSSARHPLWPAAPTSDSPAGLI